MTRLDEYASNDAYTQFGEAGMRAHIFDRIGVQSRVCVEFGANDGLSCSNTAQLWRNDHWKAVCVESDPALFQSLYSNSRMHNVIRVNTHVTPAGPYCIARILADRGIDDVDFMSIDIDGDDFHVLAQLACRPRVICIEANPTIPPHVELHDTAPGGSIGASMLAIERLASRVGYRFVGSSYCNAFLVAETEAGVFDGYDCTPRWEPGDYTYVVSDFHGRTLNVGKGLPWGAREPYVRPVTASAGLSPASDNPLWIRTGFEVLWGPARWVDTGGLDTVRLEQILDESQLVCVDLTQHGSLDAVAWMWDVAEARGRTAILVGRVLGLIPKDQL